MSVKLKYSRSVRKLILSPEMVISLADVIYMPLKKELESAERKWKSEELPKLEDKIVRHNERIEKQEHSYFFNTSEKIDNKTRVNLINTQKEFFIHTTEQVYYFRSKFEVMSDSRGVSQSSPTFLKGMDWSNVTSVTFESTTKNEACSGYIQIDLIKGRFRYEVSGTREDWVLITKDAIERILQNSIKLNFVSKHLGIFTLCTPFLLFYFVYSLLLKFKFIPAINKSNGSLYFLLIVALYVVGSSFLSEKINKLFPRLAISDSYNPLNNGFIRTLGAIMLGAGINALWDLIKFVFSI